MSEYFFTVLSSCGVNYDNNNQNNIHAPMAKKKCIPYGCIVIFN